MHIQHRNLVERSLPMLLLPKNLPALVEDGGGGGLWICDAVGARDWRIEYVRCIVDEGYDCFCLSGLVEE